MSAVISECGKYRYTLSRNCGIGPSIAWLMLNPSTADATLDDATIRKVRGFSERAGYGSFTVINLFAIRATDPKVAREAGHLAEGPENRRHVESVAYQTETVVCAWGAFPWARPQAIRVLNWISGHLREAADFRCIGYSKSGDPLHPLMQAYEKGLTNFDRTRLRDSK